MSVLEHARHPGAVAGAPSGWDFFADRLFRGLAKAAAWLILLLLGFILWQIGRKAGPALFTRQLHWPHKAGRAK